MSKAIGAKLKEIREAQFPRLSQREAAAALGKTERHYQRYEDGDTEIGRPELEKLAALLDAPELLDRAFWRQILREQ